MKLLELIEKAKVYKNNINPNNPIVTGDKNKDRILKFIQPSHIDAIEKNYP